MDLKIKDLAELLNVSQTTIRRWLKDRKLPAYQLNRQYRFSRFEIEDWMMKCRLKLGQDGFSPFEERQIYPQPEEAVVAREGSQQFALYRAMHKGMSVHDIASTSKNELIREVMHHSSRRLGLDPDLISDLLIDRENLMSTALNSGVAVPHPRDIVLQVPGSDAVVTVFPKEPIEYGALDGQPVRVLFFLFSSSDKSHLRLLAKLSHLVSNEMALDFLRKKPLQNSLLSYVKEWEEKLVTG